MNLYDVLGCPVCRNALRRTRDVLRCEGCERRYPVVQGVPVMLPAAGLMVFIRMVVSLSLWTR